jgi:hypothetical protein
MAILKDAAFLNLRPRNTTEDESFSSGTGWTWTHRYKQFLFLKGYGKSRILKHL